MAYRASEKYKEGKSVIEKFYIERAEYAEIRLAKVAKATATIKAELSTDSTAYMSTNGTSMS